MPSSTAETGLSRLDRPSAESYWMHPAVLDSALHIGAYLGVSQGAAIKIPVGFSIFTAMTRFGGSPRQAQLPPYAPTKQIEDLAFTSSIT